MMGSIEHNFRYHSPNDVKRNLHEEVRSSIRELAVEFQRSLPVGREAALVQTKLEEAMFWANAAIARSAEGNDD